MKHRILVLAAVLALGASAPALAQTSGAFSQVRKIELKGPKPNAAPTPPAAVATDKAQFGCDARAPSVCHFQIFYARGGRAIVLAAGMKTTVPDVKVGRDGYCVGVNNKPGHKCVRKTINATYNN
jgi:hypothetical protein